MRRRILPLALIPLILSCEAVLKENTEPGGSGGLPTTSAQLTTPPNPCTGCALVPTSFTRTDGQTKPYVREFPGDPAADYLLIVQDDGQKETRVQIKLNGETVIDGPALYGLKVAEIKKSVVLQASNRLTVLPLGKVGARVVVWVLSGAELVGATGATIVAEGGVSLTIPPNAVTGSHIIQINRATASLNPSFEALRRGAVIELTPSGLALASPARLRIPLVGQANPHHVGVYFLVAPDTMEYVETRVDSQSRAVTGFLDHFSTYAPIDDILTPAGSPYRWWVKELPPLESGTSTADAKQDMTLAFERWSARLPSGLVFQNVDPASTIGACPELTIVASGNFAMHRPRIIDCADRVGQTISRVIGLSPSYTWRASKYPATSNPEILDNFGHEVGHFLSIDHPLSRAECQTNGGDPVDLCSNNLMAWQGSGILGQVFAPANYDQLSDIYGTTGNSATGMYVLQGNEGTVLSPGARVPVAIQLLDGAANPVRKELVYFYTDEGSIADHAVLTDDNGVASSAWVLPTQPNSTASLIVTFYKQDGESADAVDVALQQRGEQVQLTRSIGTGGGTIGAFCGQTLDFNNAQLPQNWTAALITHPYSGSTPGLLNNRLEGKPTDTGVKITSLGGLPSGTSQLTLQWDGELLQNYWGMNFTARLQNASTAFMASVVSADYNFGPSQLAMRTGVSGSSGLFDHDQVPFTYGVHHFQLDVEDGQVTWNIRKGSTAVVSNLVQPVTNMTLAGITGLEFEVYTTVTNIIWGDNLSISCQ